MKKYLLILALLPILMHSCVKEIPVGFLSPTGIRMRTDTMEVIRGIYTVSSFPLVDGSTRPLHWEILGIKKLPSGEEAPAFNDDYDLKLWLSPYHPDTDTTMALVNEKLHTQSMKALTINPVSGQMLLNGGTATIDPGLYGVDVRVSNSSGSIDLENYSIIRLVDRPWEVAFDFSESFRGIDAGGIETRLNLDMTPAEREQIAQNTHPNYFIERVGDYDGVQVKLIFVDSEGDVYPGSVISKWPTGITYYNSWFDNSVDTKVLDDGVEFNFPTVPYPAFGRMYTDGGQLYLSYYLLPSSAYTLTPSAQSDLDNKATEMHQEFTNNLIAVRLGYKINQPGIWHVTVKFAKTIKK